MRNIIFILLLIIFIGCKENSTELSQKENKNNINYKNEVVTQNITCEEIINKIVRSSNLQIRNTEFFFTEIDRIEDDNVIIHVYVENNLSDNPKQKQMVQSTIAWLSFNPNEHKLYNTTADPYNPIELNFDKKILDEFDIFSSCKIKNKVKQNAFRTIKSAVLPLNFDEYYSACVNPYDSIICNNNYPKYLYNEKDSIAKIIKNKYSANEYMYLPKTNKFQPIILCNTDTDVESYNLIIVKENKIISSLKIGLMDGQSITQFDISKNYIINLYKRKNSLQKNEKWKSYFINENGEIIESH